MANEKVKDLTVGSPLRLMIAYAIPVLLGNMFQQIYNFADTIIVGQRLGNNALAAVGSTGAINFFINGFLFGVTSGFAVHVAQYFGAKDYEHMRKSVFNAIFLWLVITVSITAVSVLTVKPLLRAMNTPDDIFADAYIYIVIICGGCSASMLYNAVSCILRALGDSKTPLYFLILSAVLNIGLDLLLIMVFKMGVAGAAVATVISQAVSGIMCIIYAYVKFPILHLSKKDCKLNGMLIGTHLRIGLPMAFQFSITAIGTIILQGAINVFGPDHIAAYTAGCKVEQLVTQVGPACGVTAANYVGQNMGAGRYDRIRKGIRQWSMFTIGAALVAMAIVFFLGRYICLLFIQGGNKTILEYAMVYLNTITVFFIPLSLIFIFRNTLQAMGKSFMPLMAGVFELGARTVVSFTLPSVIGFKGVCLAGPIAWVAAVVPLFVTYVIYIRIFKKKGYFDR